jgi:hypothetical protein
VRTQQGETTMPLDELAAYLEGLS